MVCPCDGRVLPSARWQSTETDFWTWYWFPRVLPPPHTHTHLSLTLPKCSRCSVWHAGEAVGKSSLVPVPYEWIQKDPGCVAAHGLPEGVALQKPSEYDTKTLMKILEQSHRIQFSVKRWVGVRSLCLLLFWDNGKPAGSHLRTGEKNIGISAFNALQRAILVCWLLLWRVIGSRRAAVWKNTLKVQR